MGVGEVRVNVLIVGGGGREHAILWRIVDSPLVDNVYCAPGNAGTGLMARNLDLDLNDLSGLLAAVGELNIRLVVIGPEGPLIAGLADRVREMGVLAFGPGAAGARLEGSKAWAKELMFKYGIPCAGGLSFTSSADARAYVLSLPPPVVVKADGEALGKGVSVANSHDEALDAITRIMDDRIFGKAGDRVVIEECLVGPEVSALAFTDGETVVPMVPACDYKRIFEGDRGPNTGGMGGYSPPSFVDAAMRERILDTILKPTVAALAAEGVPYRGVLYAGLMLTAEGPKALEFNARFGDPETQIVLPRLKTDLMEVLLGVALGDLADVVVEWYDNASCGVVLASAGYPGEIVKGMPISGLDDLDDGILAFHAGTAFRGRELVTNGGRVLCLVATERDLAEARHAVYANVDKVRFHGKQYRSDIGAKEVD